MLRMRYFWGARDKEIELESVTLWRERQTESKRERDRESVTLWIVVRAPNLR